MAPQLKNSKAATLLLGVVLVVATVSVATLRGTSSDSSALKPISQTALQRLVDTTARELLVPGAVVLLRTPQHEFVASYGTTQLGTTNRPGVDTYFRIASNTKTMTAAVILQLAQEGLLGLSDPISKYVPQVPNGDNITIAQLLEMRSGLYNYSNAPELSSAIDRDHTKFWTTDELLAMAFARPPNFPPGTAYEYCNTNYALLGLVAERVGEKPLAVAMEQRLFRPLGIQHTRLPAANVNTMPEPYSHGYLYGSSSVALMGTPPYSSEVQAAARAGTLLPTDYTDVSPSIALAAGGVISTANDLATWIQDLVGGRVLNAEYQARWRNSLRSEDKPEGQEYGYGITRIHWGSNELLFHGGETVGYQSFIGYDPANRVTLVVWTNLPVSLDEKLTANELILRVLDHIYLVSPLQPSSTAATVP